jgi:hypothetical protein
LRAYSADIAELLDQEIDVPRYYAGEWVIKVWYYDSEYWLTSNIYIYRFIIIMMKFINSNKLSLYHIYCLYCIVRCSLFARMDYII